MAILQTIDDVTAQHYIEFAEALSKNNPTSQQTLQRPVKLYGHDPLGGRKVELTLYPAKPSTGIWFVLNDKDLEKKVKEGDEVKKEDFPEESSLRAHIYNASYNYSGIQLSHENLRLLYPEHLLAPLYAYNIHNLMIVVRRFLSAIDLREKGTTIGELALRMSMNSDSRPELRYFETYAIPQWQNISLEVIKAITDAGIKQQETLLSTYRLKRDFSFILEPNTRKGMYRTWSQTMELIPIESDKLVIKSATDYGDISPHQEYKLEANPLTFLTEVSEARSLFKDNHIKRIRTPRILLEFLDRFMNSKLEYFDITIPLPLLNFLANFINPEFGLGNGMTPNHFVLPLTKDKRRYGNKDRYLHGGQYSEIARHNALDRIGELALLGVPLRGAYFNSDKLRHEGSLQGLRKALEQRVFVQYS